jgi:conjugal transfer/entry exclusion protein
MNEEEVENRIDEIRDELQSYKRQLDSLQEDLKLLIKHSTTAHRDIIAMANPVDERYSDRLEVNRLDAGSFWKNTTFVFDQSQCLIFR